MKFISLIIIGLTMTMTWCLSQSQDRNTQLIQSMAMTSVLVSLEKAVNEKVPDARKVKIEKIWPEVYGHGQLRVRFKFSFSEQSPDGEEMVRSQQGVASFSKSPKSSDLEESWSLQSVQLSKESMSFSEGLTVSPE